MNIQFGCGGNRLPNFINHDAEVDITKPLPYADGVADFILAEHVAEHISAPDCLRFMEECYRILKPNGVLRLCVPILDRIQDYGHMRDLIVGHGHMVLFNLSNMVTLLHVAKFMTVYETGRRDCDSHHKVIGVAKDDLETLRVEAKKT